VQPVATQIPDDGTIPRSPHSGGVSTGLALFGRLAALDTAVVLAIAGNIAAAGLGALNAVLVANTFSPELQGFFYAFGGLVTFYVFLEFGLGQAALQFASHEWAHLGSDLDGRGEQARRRLLSLRRVCIGWYASCGLLVLIAIGPLGFAFFDRRGADLASWVGPWTVLCAGVAGNVFLAPIFLFIQSCAKTTVFWSYRFVYQIVYGVALGCAIYFGADLWSMGVATWLGLVWSGVYATRFAIRLQPSHTAPGSSWKVWSQELWPLQWRGAMAWLSSYFTIPLLILIAFHYGDPVLAGQIGISGTAGVLIMAVASSWVVTRTPTFAISVAQGKCVQAERLFRAALRVSLLAAIVGGLGLAIGVYVLNGAQHPLGGRFVQPLAMFLLMAAMVLQTMVVAIGAYIRAYKEEPLGLISVASLVCLIGWGPFLIRPLGDVGIGIAHLAVVGVVQVPAALWCLRRLRRRYDRPYVPKAGG
jgi:hypothetical protein